TDLANGVAFVVDINRTTVTAQRVISLGLPIGRLQPAKIARRFVVFQDHFLIELAQIVHYANTSRADLIPSTSASTSSFVLYTANDARAVAGIPNRSITGCAQWCPVRIAMPSRSRIVPRSCGCTPSSTNESAPARSLAVPINCTPGTAP